MTFKYGGFAGPVRQDLIEAHRAVWSRLAQPGVWWTGAERVAIAREARHAFAGRSQPPSARESAPVENALGDAAAEAARMVAVDAHRLDGARARVVMQALGDAPYVELIGVVACLVAIDAFAIALGVELEPLPRPIEGKPSRERPEGVADDGAWVPMLTPFRGPNVARALSLVPQAAMTFGGLTMEMYAKTDFANLVWTDRPLSRPQVELVAARVSALNECFY